MKKRLIVSIQLALGIIAPAHAATTLTGLNLNGGSFTHTGDTTISNSELRLNTPEPGAPYGTMSVNGNYRGNDTTVHMRTVLDAGGSTQPGQGTHRVLINGNASGQTLLTVVNNGGAGASTDLNGDAVNNAGEGISLVQVSGVSSADAFVLQGGYTAVGAFQYRLNAYQPGQSDSAQRLVNGDADGHWDYRLQNAQVATVTPVPPSPTTPPAGPEPGGPAPATRAALVPQAPSYLVHNNALFSYGQQAISALHQRLGETADSHSRGDGDLYVRAFGSGHLYASNLTTGQYGYDYDQEFHGLQIGGNVLTLDGEESRLRLGLALSSAKGRTDPRVAYAVDNTALEISREKTRADSLATTLTWEHGSGFYVDGVIGASQYRSDITTPFRAGNVARLKANDVFASVEAGYGWALNDAVTLQPQAQVSWQKLDTNRITDTDGVVVDLGSPEQFVWRVGVRALFTPKVGPDGSVLTQYIKLNYYDSEGPAQRALLSGERFVTGEYGHTAEFGFGLTASLKNNLSFYGDAAWQEDIGHASRQGWAASLGLRWSF